MHRFRSRYRVAGIGFALALTVAACGTDTASTTEAAEQSTEEASPTSSADTDSETTAAPSTEADPAEAAGPAAPVTHIFPDLNTVNVADGSTLNLAEELAGGDTPILLWFFAPH